MVALRRPWEQGAGVVLRGALGRAWTDIALTVGCQRPPTRPIWEVSWTTWKPLVIGLLLPHRTAHAATTPKRSTWSPRFARLAWRDVPPPADSSNSLVSLVEGMQGFRGRVATGNGSDASGVGG